jgi:hypothetical protein
MSTPTLIRASELPEHQPQRRGGAEGVPRNKLGQPYAVPFDGGRPVRLGRASSAGEELEDTTFLSKWKVRQALIGAATKPDLLAGVPELDMDAKDDKSQLDALGERLQAIAGSNRKRDRGSELHSYTELIDKGQLLPADIDPRAVKQMGEYMLATMHFQVRDVERFSVCIDKGNGIYRAGTPDRILEYAGPGPDGSWLEGLVVGDLKTGSITYPMKMACQLSIYSRSLWYDHRYFPVNTDDAKAFDKWKKNEFPADDACLAYAGIGARQDWGLIIHMPSDGDETTLWWIDLNLGWEALLLAEQVKQIRARGRKALSPFVADVTPAEVASAAAGV